ncbi:MAG TPA: sigma-54 dependent transcriptional regulator [Terriglobia bacterium]|nr:sigma-54 dependent transcriptional regulator [Terriglobia bacterium]
MSANFSTNGSGYSGAEKLPPEEVIFGLSDAMQILRRKIARVSEANVPVLICGESGTGKEILAKLIHQWSLRRDAPFVKVNCPAIPETLLESELFGYEKGAFTGAYGSKPGRVETASRGTLFLDEISEIDLSLQAKLLQLLQDGQFCRLGGQEERHVDVRVICATNRVLEGQIEAGAFRPDLFYRINVFTLRVPPLRQRSLDLPRLVEYLIASCNERFNRRAKPLSPQLMRALEEHCWPGNIRELENLIKRYVIMGTEDSIAGELRGPGKRRALTQTSGETWADTSAKTSAAGTTTLKGVARRAMRDFERKVILEALETSSWNRKEAARSLNISYRALLYKLRQVGWPAQNSPGGSPPRMGD